MTTDELFSIKIDKPDSKTGEKCKKRWDALAKPIDGLGELEASLCRISSVTGRVIPDIKKKALIIMCADNGIVKEGVTQTGQEVTGQVASLMGKGKSSVGVMKGDYPLDILVYDVGINSDDTPEGVIKKKLLKGSADFLEEPSMSPDICLAAIGTGIDAVRECAGKGYGIIATGEMGIGNTTTSTALACAFLKLPAKELTGRGSGLSDEGLEKKIRVIEKGLELYTKGEKITGKEEAFEVLRCFGGIETAALTGVFIGGALYHIPIVIDGVISAAAAYTAELLIPGCREYMLASHLGREKAMRLLLEGLGLKAMIHSNLALGEGTGAILLFPMLDMAANLLQNGTSFDDTKILRYERFDK